MDCLGCKFSKLLLDLLNIMFLNDWPTPQLLEHESLNFRIGFCPFSFEVNLSSNVVNQVLSLF